MSDLSDLSDLFASRARARARGHARDADHLAYLFFYFQKKVGQVGQVGPTAGGQGFFCVRPFWRGGKRSDRSDSAHFVVREMDQ